jgi:NAD-specific glutamate dehydrogenase
MKRAGKTPFDEALANWLDEQQLRVARLQRTLEEMRTSGPMDFSTLSIALREVGRLH